MRLGPAHTRRFAARRVPAGVLSFILVLALAPRASASTQSKLSDAKRQLTALMDQIKTQEANAQTAENQLADLNARVVSATQLEDHLSAQLLATQTSIAADKAAEEDLQAKFDAMLRSTYMTGSGVGGIQGQVLASMLSSTSLADLSDRAVYASALAQSSVDLSTQLSNAKALLEARATDQSRLLAHQTSLLANLHDAQLARSNAVAAQRDAVAALDQTKERILSLIVRLQKQLKAQELKDIGGAFQGGEHITYGAWAGYFLRTMNAPSCKSNLVVVVAWQLSEFTQAAWNPLATTHPMPGSTPFNSSNVQNYPTLAVGLQASKDTLVQGSPTYGYGAIISSLSGCSDAMTTARAINASSWCRGCAYGTYVTGNIAKVEANYKIYAAL
jgi:peptidoglycan hydrolase CwlO-like protein